MQYVTSDRNRKAIVTRVLAISIITMLLAQPVLAADRITVEQIQQVISATDAAAKERNTPGIEKYLGENFEKKLDMRHGKWLATIKVRRDQYLAMIDEGWEEIEEYDYRRDNTVIYIAADGLNGESYSTITETFVNEDGSMVSKVREHARYALEDGKPVITHISGHTLVGDTTPKVEQ
jgi:hypothetical protein